MKKRLYSTIRCFNFFGHAFRKNISNFFKKNEIFTSFLISTLKICIFLSKDTKPVTYAMLKSTPLSMELPWESVSSKSFKFSHANKTPAAESLHSHSKFLMVIIFCVVLDLCVIKVDIGIFVCHFLGEKLGFVYNTIIILLNKMLWYSDHIQYNIQFGIHQLPCLEPFCSGEVLILFWFRRWFFEEWIVIEFADFWLGTLLILLFSVNFKLFWWIVFWDYFNVLHYI